jgi:hypothetical protein
MSPQHVADDSFCSDCSPLTRLNRDFFASSGGDNQHQSPNERSPSQSTSFETSCEGRRPEAESNTRC